jgi:hypothetical protein
MRAGQDVAVRVFADVAPGWVVGTIVDADGTLIVEIPNIESPDTRFRCPQCQTLFWTEDAECFGGWPVYDPQRPAGERYPRHIARRVVPDRQ